jgi:hypothetical protein
LAWLNHWLRHRSLAVAGFELSFLAMVGLVTADLLSPTSTGLAGHRRAAARQAGRGSTTALGVHSATMNKAAASSGQWNGPV